MIIYLINEGCIKLLKHDADHDQTVPYENSFEKMYLDQIRLVCNSLSGLSIQALVVQNSISITNLLVKDSLNLLIFINVFIFFC